MTVAGASCGSIPHIGRLMTNLYLGRLMVKILVQFQSTVNILMKTASAVVIYCELQ